MVAGLFGIYFEGALFSPRPAVIAVQAAAVLLFVWARLTFGLRSFHATANPTEGGLVTTGPYRWIRHPIYTAVVIFTAAGTAARLSLVTGAFWVLLLAGALLRIAAEETLLVARYPEYRDYAARTRRMIPLVF